jgi:3-oxoacyl-[acyl-carrier protein] reductase
LEYCDPRRALRRHRGIAGTFCGGAKSASDEPAQLDARSIDQTLDVKYLYVKILHKAMGVVMGKLTGKVALVTGGSRGMGAAIALRLGQEGADIALTYAKSADKAQQIAQAIETSGARALAVEADNASSKSIEDAVTKSAKHFGRLDILINNAGIFLVGPVDTVALEDFDRTFDVNVRAVFVASKSAARHMGEGGRIISIGSNFAERVPGPGIAIYAASKAALIGLTKGMARDLGPRGITVNVVQPGSTNTDMNPADGPNNAHQLDRMAIRRFGEPQDIADLVVWLAGSESQFMTGSSITIDGGSNA